MKTLFAFSFIAFILSLIKSFCLFDHILKYQFRVYHGAWVTDGKPAGYFWIPETKPTINDCRIRNMLYAKYLLRTPEWIRTNDERAMIVRYRIWGAIILASGLTALISILLANINYTM